MITPPNDAIPAEAEAALLQGRHVDAIKAVRNARGLGLKEAKDVIDAYVRARPDLAARLAEVNAANLKKLAGLVAFLTVGMALLRWLIAHK